MKFWEVVADSDWAPGEGFHVHHRTNFANGSRSVWWLSGPDSPAQWLAREQVQELPDLPTTWTPVQITAEEFGASGIRVAETLDETIVKPVAAAGDALKSGLRIGLPFALFGVLGWLLLQGRRR